MRLATELDAQVRLVHVCPRSPLREAVHEGLLESDDSDLSVAQKVREAADEEFDVFLQAAAAEHLGVQRVLLFGDPAHKLCEYAAANGIDLIVMGRRGATLADVVLGSVAERVIRHAPCPVLIVRRGL